MITVASFLGIEVLALSRLDLSPAAFLHSIKSTLLERSSFRLVSWDMIRDSSIQLPCGAAYHIVAAYATQLVRTAGTTYHQISFEQAQTLRAHPRDLSDAAGWERMSSLIRQTELALQATLAAVSTADVHFEYLTGCASRVLADVRPQLQDIPVYLRRLGDPFVHKDTSSLPFTRRSSPVRTVRLETAQQLRTSSYRPRAYHDILDKDAIEAIQVWLHVERSNMVAIAQFGPSVRKIKNAVKKLRFGQAVEPHDTLVIGQDQFLEPARGIIWDCRGFEHGHSAVPMDFNAAPNSDLNNDFILEALAPWPDQEMVGFLVDGVQFRADLPLQIVMGPHLSSLSNAWDNVESEILRLENLGYYDIFAALPFLPMRSVPQGSTPRQYEKGRDRRISEGGCPRVVTLDKAGKPAVSLNVAIGLHAWEHDNGTNPVSPDEYEDWEAISGLDAANLRGSPENS